MFGHDTPVNVCDVGRTESLYIFLVFNFVCLVMGLVHGSCGGFKLVGGEAEKELIWREKLVRNCSRYELNLVQRDVGEVKVLRMKSLNER